MVLELKWDKTAEGAISQIKNKGYVSALKEYKGNILLVGINYEKKSGLKAMAKLEAERIGSPLFTVHRQNSLTSLIAQILKSFYFNID